MKNFQEKYISTMIENHFKKNEMNQITVESTDYNIEYAQYGDLLIYHKEELIAIIEVKKSISAKRYINTQIEKWGKLDKKFEFYIIISETDSILYNRNLTVLGVYTESLDSLLNNITNNYVNNRFRHQELNRVDEELINNEINHYLRNFFKSHINESDLENIIRYLYVDISKKEITFTKNSDIILFDFLLETPDPQEKFYRYLSLESAFMSISGEKLMFSGIVGMNNTTEVDYVENYLFKHTIDDKRKHWTHIEKLNGKYIMSCTTLEDNLTFWRLYGEDFKGASFEMKLSESNNKYIIKKVHYAKKNGKDDILDLIQDFYNYVYNKFGFKVIFKNIEIWKHFFKPYDYEVEQEVRILYRDDDVSKRVWMLTNSHKILNPFIFVEMKDLPFKINKIYLGSKHVFYSTNEYQFQQLLRDKKLHHNIEINVSKIINYR